MEVISSITHMAIAVHDPTQVGVARRTAAVMADRLEFSEEQAGKVAIVVTEAATNLARHARNGELLLCPCDRQECGRSLDVIAIDRGPGIADPARSMDDGYSTSGTPGNGLGAIRRLSSTFELYSQPATGTVLLARIQANGIPPSASVDGWSAGFVCIPVKGERVSGDAVALRTAGSGGSFMVADGLGHGIAANEASIEAAKIFSEHGESGPAELVDSLNRGLRATRGAAVAVAKLDRESRQARFSGIGNIAASICHGESTRSMVSHNGIVGTHPHRIREFSYEWPKSGVLIMNSDGLLTNWRLNQYPGLMQRDPAVIAAVLYRDFSRGRDDVAILVVKDTGDA